MYEYNVAVRPFKLELAVHLHGDLKKNADVCKDTVCTVYRARNKRNHDFLSSPSASVSPPRGHQALAGTSYQVIPSLLESDVTSPAATYETPPFVGF